MCNDRNVAQVHDVSLCKEVAPRIARYRPEGQRKSANTAQRPLRRSDLGAGAPVSVARRP
ncbi:hypothetical protein JL2886_00233 [Phaeobacter gallaeciensis]|uniref:Uncharacterized protein n=1 Tax=Phaeobacter gallaeciensis TaxID=60890 RepID=A0A1B0ZLY3_9RHOB|nr:hypothetical protein JL2886_00233 [Phaeobacter gallaeciensis]